LEAAVKAGAPEGIIGWIDVPSLELTNLVMREADVILATGVPDWLKQLTLRANRLLVSERAILLQLLMIRPTLSWQ